MERRRGERGALGGACLVTRLSRTPCARPAALHVAALCAQVGAAEELLRRGAWVECCDSGDATPLCLAAGAVGGGQLTRRLLAAGAAHAARDGRGLTALAHAVANDCSEATEALLSAGARPCDAARKGGYSLLHLACALGSVGAGRLLLARGQGSMCDAGNDGAATPLHAAALAGHPATLALCLGWREGGRVDVNARNADGQTALDLAMLLSSDTGDTDAAACQAALRAAGAKTGAQLPAASAPPPARAPPYVGDVSDPSLAEALRFAALPPARQSEQLIRWSASPDALPPSVQAHLRAAAVLRSAADLDDAVLRMLEDDAWQERMANPVVRRAVEAVQADPTAVKLWDEQPECFAALGELRRLQAFCKPRGLKTTLQALLRTGPASVDDARERLHKGRAAAANAIESARIQLLALAQGQGEAPALPTPPPHGAVPAVVAAAATAEDGRAQAMADTSVPMWSWAALGRQARTALLRSALSALITVLVMRALGFWHHGNRIVAGDEEL